MIWLFVDSDREERPANTTEFSKDFQLLDLANSKLTKYTT